LKLLVEGTVIEWINDDSENLLERVLWVNSDGTQVICFPLNDYKKALPNVREVPEIEDGLKEGYCIKRKIDPLPLPSLPNTQKIDKHLERRDYIWEIIKDIVIDEPDIYNPKFRGVMIGEAIKKSGKSKRDIYSYLRKYWAFGKTRDALFPNYINSGGRGKERGSREGVKRGRPSFLSDMEPQKTGINVDEETKRIFQVGVNLYYNSSKKFPLKHTYDKIIANHFNKGFEEIDGVKVPVIPPSHEIPTYEQFYYWYKKNQNLEKTLISREGERGFALRERPVLGGSTQMAYGPGSIYQIDATIADVYLVNKFDRTKIIGRPVIYMIVDVFSRMITGMYVGLEGPSWAGAKMALANTFEDKISYCKQYDIDIEEKDFPCRYLPDSILADRGEIIGIKSDQLADSLGITLQNTPPFRADWKGIVEQNFRLLNLKTIHWLPGAIKKRYRERGGKDHRLDAKLDLSQFTKIMIRTVLTHNHNHRMDWYPRTEQMIQEQVQPYPLDLWNWGLKNKSGHLREKSTDLVRLSLMPKDDARVTKRGIKFRGMYYSCETALRNQWFTKAGKKTWKVKVSYDFRKADVIYLINENKGSFERCELLDRESRFRGYRIEEVLDLKTYQTVEKLEAETRRLQSNTTLHTYIDSIVQEAAEQTNTELKEKPMSENQRTKKIRENKAEAIELIRDEEAWNIGDDSVNDLQADYVKEEDEEEEELTPRMSRQKSFLSLLKNQRK
jgi:putative transposase